MIATKLKSELSDQVILKKKKRKRKFLDNQKTNKTATYQHLLSMHQQKFSNSYPPENRKDSL